MKNQNNKSEINRRRPRGIRAPRQWEEDGPERWELPRSPNKGLLLTVLFLWEAWFPCQLASAGLSNSFPSSSTEEEMCPSEKQEAQSGLKQPLRAIQEMLYSHIS